MLDYFIQKNLKNLMGSIEEFWWKTKRKIKRKIMAISGMPKIIKK
jgi:hypothetical protein